MKGSQTDVEIDTNISYSLNNDSFNKPLRLHNHSDHTYVFKVLLPQLRSKPTKKLSSVYKQPTISSFPTPSVKLPSDSQTNLQQHPNLNCSLTTPLPMQRTSKIKTQKW